jgi:hypothetical protein
MSDPTPLNKTLALRTVVVEALQTVMPEGSAIYYQTAQKEHPKIYAVYLLDQILNQDDRYMYELEINVMDYGTNTSTVEDLCDSIQSLFNKKVVITNDIGVYFYTDRRNTVDEEDRNIIRRRLTFSAYLYER